MEFLNFNSVELLPNAKASAAFMVDSGKVFREDICTLYSVGFAQVATVRCVITNTFALHSLTRNFLCTLLSVLLVPVAYKSRKFVEFGKFVFF